MDKRTQNLMIGKGGESAVMSELLFRGYNANFLTVDAGIDIVAIKDKRTYLIQVKTKHWNKKNQFVVILEIDALERYNQENIFFVIVGRDKEILTNEFIIIPVDIFYELKEKMKIKKSQREKPAIRFIFRKRKTDGKITLNKYGEIEKFRTAWHLIK